MVLHHHRTLQGFQETLFSDIGIGVMDEYTRIHIPVGIDVQITLSAGNAAADKFRIILEVHCKQRFGFTVSADPLIHTFPLLRCRKKLNARIVSNRHVMEEPDKERTFTDHKIVEFFRGDGLIVLTGIACGNSERKPFLTEHVHGIHNMTVNTSAAPAVSGAFKSLQGYRRHKVADPEHLIRKGFINQCAVREAEEDTVIMLFTDPDQIILPDKRFASGIDIHVDTKFLALTDDVINFIKGQVQFISIFCSPAAGAVQIAGAGRIKQNRPRNVAVVFLPVFLEFRP